MRLGADILTVENLPEERKEVIDDIKLKVKSIMKQKPSDKKKKNSVIVTNKPTNFISILGNRGTGKTSMLYTVLEKLESENENEEKKKYYTLPLIDPDRFNAEGDVLGWVIFGFNDIIKELKKSKKAENYDYCNGGKLTELFEKYEDLKSHYQQSRKYFKNNMSYLSSSSREYRMLGQESIFSDMKLYEKFGEFVTSLSNIIKKMNDLENKPLFLIAFDDADLNPEYGAKVLSVMHNYLKHESIVVFILGEYITYKKTLELDAIRREKIHKLPGEIDYLLEEKSRLAEEYLEKVMPEVFRYDLKGFSHNDKLNFTPYGEKKDEINSIRDFFSYFLVKEHKNVGSKQKSEKNEVDNNQAVINSLNDILFSKEVNNYRFLYKEYLKLLVSRSKKIKVKDLSDSDYEELEKRLDNFINPKKKEGKNKDDNEEKRNNEEKRTNEENIMSCLKDFYDFDEANNKNELSFNDYYKPSYAGVEDDFIAFFKKRDENINSVYYYDILSENARRLINMYYSLDYWLKNNKKENSEKYEKLLIEYTKIPPRQYGYNKIINNSKKSYEILSKLYEIIYTTITKKEDKDCIDGCLYLDTDNNEFVIDFERIKVKSQEIYTKRGFNKSKKLIFLYKHSDSDANEFNKVSVQAASFLQVFYDLIRKYLYKENYSIVCGPDFSDVIIYRDSKYRYEVNLDFYLEYFKDYYRFMSIYDRFIPVILKDRRVTADQFVRMSKVFQWFIENSLDSQQEIDFDLSRNQKKSKLEDIEKRVKQIEIESNGDLSPTVKNEYTSYNIYSYINEFEMLSIIKIKFQNHIESNYQFSMTFKLNEIFNSKKAISTRKKMLVELFNSQTNANLNRQFEFLKSIYIIVKDNEKLTDKMYEDIEEYEKKRFVYTIIELIEILSHEQSINHVDDIQTLLTFITDIYRNGRYKEYLELIDEKLLLLVNKYHLKSYTNTKFIEEVKNVKDNFYEKNMSICYEIIDEQIYLDLLLSFNESLKPGRTDNTRPSVFKSYLKSKEIKSRFDTNNELYKPIVNMLDKEVISRKELKELEKKLYFQIFDKYESNNKELYEYFYKRDETHSKSFLESIWSEYKN